MEAVLDKKIKALDYFTDKELSNKEIKSNCGYGDEQVAIMDSNDSSISYKTVRKQVYDLFKDETIIVKVAL